MFLYVDKTSNKTHIETKFSYRNKYTINFIFAKSTRSIYIRSQIRIQQNKDAKLSILDVCIFILKYS